MTSFRGLVPVEGTTLYAEADGEGPVVVLLHGRGYDHRMWAPQIAALARHFRVVRYDLRGFGRSAPGANRFSHADDLAALLDHLGIERAALVGLSLGGGAAINAAVLHPGRLWALVAVDSSLGGHPLSPELQAFFADTQRAALAQGIDAAKRLYFDSALLARPRVRERWGPLLDAMERDYSGSHWVTPDLGRPLDPPAIARLGEIRVPTLVVVGEHDLPDFRSIADTLARGIPGARMLVVAGAGHLPNLETPERFDEALVEFLGDATATT